MTSHPEAAAAPAASNGRTGPTLLILAAGVGSRYGGLKQLDSFGPAGETIMDYTAYDAWRAGFARVVFVVRAETEALFRETLGARIARRVSVSYVQQRLESLPHGWIVPPGRTKPWGTGHAVLAAADAVHEPFIVANADDFYGATAIAALGEFVSRQTAPTPSYAMVAYRLRETLAEGGTVSRGVCHCSDGWLDRITEITAIERDEHQNGVVRDAEGLGKVIPGETLVSMNLWGFQPGFFDELRAGFHRFLLKHGHTLDREYYLPVAVQEAMQHQVRVRVLPSTEAWCGVTHRADRAQVEGAIRARISRGEYPSPLWG